MNGGSPRGGLNGKDSSGSSGKHSLMGLVRRVSRSGKMREKGNRVMSETTEFSSSGYKRVSPNIAPSSLYPSTSPATIHHEVLVWGRRPALSNEGRTIEGIELVDEGPSQKPGSSRPIRQVQRISSKSRDPPHIEEEKPGIHQRRRSIDSLISSINVNTYVPLLPHHEKISAKAANSPRRAVSVRVDGPRSSNLARVSSISSTPRAKPAQEMLVSPPRQRSPFQGANTSAHERSISVGGSSVACLDHAEEERLREAYKGKGAVWAVARGWKRGIVATFEEADQQTRNFPGPILRQFDSVEEAIEFLSPSKISRPNTGEKGGYTGVHFGSTSLNRQFSHQRQPSSPDHQADGASRRTIKSPLTNPFLTDMDRQLSSRSYSNASSAQRPLANRNSSSVNDILENKEFLLPPPILFNSQTPPKSTTNQGVAVTSMIMCQDLESSISFYRHVLGFIVDTTYQSKDETLLRHNSAQTASLTIRLRTPTSPSKVASSTSPSKLPLSMYRSSILLDLGHCDMLQLHTEISSKLVSFQSELKNLTTRRPSLNQYRIEDIETKPWGSSEFFVFDPEGNMIAIKGSN